MILLWGLDGDRPFDSVLAALRRRNANVMTVEQRRALEIGVELISGNEIRGSIEFGGRTTSLEEIGAAYWRTYDIRHLPVVLDAAATSDGQEALAAVSELEGALLAWLEVTTAYVINRPAAMASNGSKPYQCEIARSQGFEVPKTLVTTDPAAARRFWTDCGAVIYKSISGTRSIVSKLDPSHLARIDDVVWCPTQFQQFVPGRDHRVHVVGDDLFACEVISDADDYRYAGLRGEPARVVEAKLPNHIAERCLGVTRSLGLHLAGIDLRLAPDGRWFCFEINPSPGFSYYEAHTGQPLADAIASQLISRDR